ncbi:hypothetical protein IJT93_13310 [bacterium]|nr:hypothetical protein [bacterium]
MQNSSDKKSQASSESHSSDSEVLYAGSSDSNQKRVIAPLPLDAAEMMAAPSVQEAAEPFPKESAEAAGADDKDENADQDILFPGTSAKINPEPTFAGLSEISEAISDSAENSESYWICFYEGLSAVKNNQEQETSPAAESPRGASADTDKLDKASEQKPSENENTDAEPEDEFVFNTPGSSRTVSSSSEYTVTGDPNKTENAAEKSGGDSGNSKKNGHDPQQGKIISFLSFVNKKQNKENVEGTKKLTAEERLDNLQKETQAEQEKQKTPPDYFKLFIHVSFFICFITICILLCLTYIWPDYLKFIFLSQAAAQAILLALMLYLTFDICFQVEPGNFRKVLLIIGLIIITELAVILKYI